MQLRAQIARTCPTLAAVAFVAAAALFVASFTTATEHKAVALADLGMLVGLVGALVVAGRITISQAAKTSDLTVMMVSAAAADALRAHLEPNSPWRLNMIREIADYINGENEMTLAAIEGTALDLGEQVRTMRAELDRLQGGT